MLHPVTWGFTQGYNMTGLQPCRESLRSRSQPKEFVSYEMDGASEVPQSSDDKRITLPSLIRLPPFVCQSRFHGQTAVVAHRPKLSDSVREGPRLQPGRDGRVRRCSAWLSIVIPFPKEQAYASYATAERNQPCCEGNQVAV